jgi:regulator of sigma E protease
LGGPVRIAAGRRFRRSGFGSLLMFTAFLSLNLAILNCCRSRAGRRSPGSAVDRSRDPPAGCRTKIKIVAQQIGMALLLALMVFVIFNDVINLF